MPDQVLLRAHASFWKSLCGPTAAALAVLMTAAPAPAQWTVSNLHPGGGVLQSTATGTSGVQQVGWTGFDQFPRASLWSGSAGSWIDLHPNGAVRSIAYGTSGSQQAGRVSFNAFTYRAALWNGTAESWTDLTPLGAVSAGAYAIAGSQQAGYSTFPLGTFAGIWNGSAESWINLNPAGALSSVATGTSGSQQVGWSVLDVGGRRAALWNGTAQSWVDLHPSSAPGITDQTTTMAFATSGLMQAGIVENYDLKTTRYVRRPCAWSGSVESFVDLTPLGSTEGEALAAWGLLQGGYAIIDGYSHAGLWSGTAESWEDLHAVLPPEFIASRASSLWSDGATLFVGGSGYNTTTGRQEALLWSRPVPSPANGLGLCLALAWSRRRSRS